MAPEGAMQERRLSLQKTLQAVDHEAAGLSGIGPTLSGQRRMLCGPVAREIQNMWRTPRLNAVSLVPVSELLPTE